MSVHDVIAFIKDLLRDYPHYAAALVFVLAFGESLAFLSLILPFWGILFGLGTIIGSAQPVLFWTILSAAAIGAAMGDWLSYWFGFHYHEQVRNMWPLNKNPGLIDKGHKFFEKYGAWAIVFGRFWGPLRASIPLVAGITEMPMVRFQVANWTSAFLWAFVLLSPGTFGLTWLIEKMQ